MNRRASALLPVVGLVSLVAIPLAWRFAAAPPVVASTMIPASPLFASSSEGTADLQVALLRAGVSPQALAAAGAPTGGVFGIVEAAEQHFGTAAATLTAADTAYASAKRESDRLRRLIESGKASQEDVAAHQTQVAALASATNAQESALGALFDAATASLTANQRALLRRIQSAQSWGLPIEFGVVERSEANWVELRGALANERFAAKYGEEADQAAAAFLANARSDQAVAAAKTALDTNGAFITASWNSAHED